MMFGWLFGKNAKDQGEQDATEELDHPKSQATNAALDAYWSKIGETDSDFITYMINPSFQGAPSWPGVRQAYRVVRTPDSLIISSDGMSEPFSSDLDSQLNGFELEVFIEVPGLEAMPHQEIQGSPYFQIVEHIAQQFAGMGNAADLLKAHGILSMAIPCGNDSLPREWQDGEGNVGILLNMPFSGRENEISDMPLSPVRLVGITILMPGEVDYAANGGEARADLADRLHQAGYGHKTVIPRDRVI